MEISKGLFSEGRKKVVKLNSGAAGQEIPEGS
jgi:hypothetical protein